MKDRTIDMLGWTIPLSLFILIVGGFMIALPLSKASFTVKIEMDDNTKEYLIAHNYCMVNEYNESKSTTFMGECEFIEKSWQGER